MSNFEVSLPKCEDLLLDTAQREDVSNQQERKKLSEGHPTFNHLRHQVKELAQDCSFSEVFYYKHLPFEQCQEVKLHIWAGKLQSSTPETQIWRHLKTCFAGVHSRVDAIDGMCFHLQHYAIRSVYLINSDKS